MSQAVQSVKTSLEGALMKMTGRLTVKTQTAWKIFLKKIKKLGRFLKNLEDFLKKPGRLKTKNLEDPELGKLERIRPLVIKTTVLTF